GIAARLRAVIPAEWLRRRRGLRRARGLSGLRGARRCHWAARHRRCVGFGRLGGGVPREMRRGRDASGGLPRPRRGRMKRESRKWWERRRRLRGSLFWRWWSCACARLDICRSRLPRFANQWGRGFGWRFVEGPKELGVLS